MPLYLDNKIKTKLRLKWKGKQGELNSCVSMCDSFWIWNILLCKAKILISDSRMIQR